MRERGVEEERLRQASSGNRSEVPPLSQAEVAEYVSRDAEGDIPEELRSMLLPEVEPYELWEIDIDREEQPDVEPTTPMIPAWFGATSAPRKARLPVPSRLRLHGREVQPLTVFPPDDRKIYYDIKYPWGTICKVITGAGNGSGVIVGPRHVLTASHVVDWSKKKMGTVEVHRSAASVRATTAIKGVWAYTKISGNTVGWYEDDEDYACLITANRIGDLFGWMGVRTYNNSWDDEPYWWNIGYPASIGSGSRPTFQMRKKLDEPWYDSGPARSMATNADITKGNSGGPMFGFWKDGPYVVAVVSSEDKDDNWCSGGNWLTHLVNHARSKHP